MRRSSLSSSPLAQQANQDLYAALRAHFQGAAPANLTSLLSPIEDAYNSVKNKINSLEHCERLIRNVKWVDFWALQSQTPPTQQYDFTSVDSGLMTIRLNPDEAMSLLFVLLEHLTSCTKNLGDVFAVLLNDLWQLGLRGAGVNLGSVNNAARHRNQGHPIVTLLDPIFSAQASWLNVASNIRNKSQHRDATTILVIPVGRNATEAPYVDSALYPGANTLSRRLDHFCPWLKDQAFQFVEDLSRVLSGSPVL
jgi:hypothetical protein